MAVRLDELARRMGDRITVDWRPFLLRPESIGMSRDEFVAYTNSWSRPAEMEPATTFTTPWASQDPPPRSSLEAQVAAKLVDADQSEVSEAYHRALMVAYFTDNRDISDRAVQAEVLGRVGGDGAALLTALDERYDETAALVLGENALAHQLGITAVPTVVVNGTMAIPGAQEVDSYQTWIENIIARQG